jgi:SAM-dependent methyltransferase
MEVGSGSGVVLRDLARRVGPTGRATGLDYDPRFLEFARELAERDGLADRIELRQGDARAMPFEDGQFDVALAATTLAHVPDGERAIPEMVRVVRPGGRVAIFERDVDSMIIAHPDRELTRRIIHAGADQATVNGLLARRLPGLLIDAGLLDLQVRAFVTLERQPDSYYGQLCHRRAEVALQSGVISEAEARRWLDQLRAEEAAGRTLVGLTQIFAWGTRPAR